MKRCWVTYPLTIARPFDPVAWLRAEFYTRRKGENEYPLIDPYRDDEGRTAREAERKEERK